MHESASDCDIVPRHDSIVHVLVLAETGAGEGHLVEFNEMLFFKFEAVGFEEDGASVNKCSVPVVHGFGSTFRIENTVVTASHPQLSLEILLKLISLHFLKV